MTVVEDQTSEGVDRELPSRDAFILRVATAYLIVSHDHAGGEPDPSLAERVQSALNEDARVTAVDVPEMDSYWSPQVTVYPAVETAEDDEGVIDAWRHLHAQVFSRPIKFRVHVPAKNQPKVFQDDEIPSEDYTVRWNGQSLLVAWRQDADAPLSSSGGHVVEEILEQATGRVGLDVYIQACNPSCEFVFVHTDVMLLFEPEATEWSHFREPGDPTLVAVTPGEGDLEEAADRAWGRYRSALRDFADVKNIGRQIIDLERVLRSDLDHLNGLYYRRAEASHSGWKTRALVPWNFRGWRRESRYYLARLWLGLGTLEHLRRLWFDRKAEFDRSTSADNIGALFAVDSADEFASIQDLDLSLTEAAIEHAGARLDIGALAGATLGGAFAGAVVAAVVTILLA